MTFLIDIDGKEHVAINNLLFEGTEVPDTRKLSIPEILQASARYSSLFISHSVVGVVKPGSPHRHFLATSRAS